ncbi:MAG: Crp/Fnr family transcriptional regulator [Oscillospiraceae bacterium]|nr:Crp/Fnr family transcriptional regulator [Oscillospiraceae bacterium]
MYDILNKNSLFEGIEPANIQGMLKCLDSRLGKYKKGEYIFLSGQSKPAVGILIKGKAQVVKENILGDSMIIGSLVAGELFGETYACLGENTISVSVVAQEYCEVLLLDMGNVIKTCKFACPHHQMLISNLLRVIAGKCINLNQKMSYFTFKTIRGRLIAFFYDRMELNNSLEFRLPFGRQELADYLGVDRSAMCRELSNMKRDGLIDYNGRNIKWIDNNNNQY